MTRSELNEEYFNWMCSLVYDEQHFRKMSFQKLLRYLNGIDFIYILPMDDNRAVDGIDLRYRFGYESKYPDPMIATYLDDHPCSVLEMMVALSFRCEEQIMSDPDYGDRTAQWFWTMISNLGLESENDLHFDSDYVDKVIDIFMNREYESNGEGGLFVLNNCRCDLRRVEIWCQMCWYLDEVLNLEGI